MARQFDEHNSHYLNEKNRIIPQSGPDFFRESDADYNIPEGQTFGPSESVTLEQQGWRSEL